jgi:hypothetical protein
VPTTARQVAQAYDRYVAAVWRGETAATARFAIWLRGCWDLGPPEPDDVPQAISALGGAGASIRWHETPATILGYIPGVPHRCYQVSRSEPVPDVVEPSIERARAADVRSGTTPVKAEARRPS